MVDIQKNITLDLYVDDNIHHLFYRGMRCSMDSLKFSCNWRGSVQGAKIPIKLGGLQLEGCVFDGNRLMENQRDSPIVSAIPVCTVGWVSKVTDLTARPTPLEIKAYVVYRIRLMLTLSWLSTLWSISLKTLRLTVNT